MIRLNSSCVGRSLARTIRELVKTREYSGCLVHGLRYAGFSVPKWGVSLRCPIVAAIHGVDPFMEMERNRPAIRRLVERASALFERVVLVGNPLRSHAEALGLPANKFEVVPNGVALPEMDARQARPGRPAGRVRVLSVSNLIPLKGIDYNLKALAALRESNPGLDWEYVVIGDGPVRADLEFLAEDLGIGSLVRFLGRLPYEETQSEMAEADVFSLPSWNEAFGIVYLEAMARGVPAIGCLENGAADIINDGVDGLLVAPKSVDGLRDALTRLISDTNLRRSLGVCARETAERFTWDANVQRISALLGVAV